MNGQQQQPKVKHTYTIVSVDTTKKLENKINDMLEEGYLLAGEFRISISKDKTTFIQPMMKSVILSMPPNSEPRADLKGAKTVDFEKVTDET